MVNFSEKEFEEKAKKAVVKYIKDKEPENATFDGSTLYRKGLYEDYISMQTTFIDSAKPKKRYEVLYYKDSNGLFLSVSKHVEDKVMFLDRLDSKEDLDNE